MNRDADPSYCVVLFPSVSGALMAEKILQKASLPYKVIPVPRHLSSDCGVCLRIERRDQEQVRALLAPRAEFERICDL